MWMVCLRLCSEVISGLTNCQILMAGSLPTTWPSHLHLAGGLNKKWHGYSGKPHQMNEIFYLDRLPGTLIDQGLPMTVTCSIMHDFAKDLGCAVEAVRVCSCG